MSSAGAKDVEILCDRVVCWRGRLRRGNGNSSMNYSTTVQLLPPSPLQSTSSAEEKGKSSEVKRGNECSEMTQGNRAATLLEQSWDSLEFFERTSRNRTLGTSTHESVHNVQLGSPTRLAGKMVPDKRAQELMTVKEDVDEEKEEGEEFFGR